MNNKNIMRSFALILFTLALIFSVSGGGRLSYTWADSGDINSTGCTVEGDCDDGLTQYYSTGCHPLGDRNSVTLDLASWTDSTSNVSLCNETMSVYYKGSTCGAGTWSTVSAPTRGQGLTLSNGSSSYSIGLSQSGIKSVLFNFTLTHQNASVTGSNVNCSLSGMTIQYDNYLSDTLEGLPAVGEDVASFLSNLAPGVGAFILILGVFGGVAGIIFAIVIVVKKKVGGGEQDV